MGDAAEKLKPSARQRLNDEIAAAAAAFAAKIVGALVEFQHAENEDGGPKRKRTPQRIPYVPLDEPPSTPEEIEEARRARRRIGQ